MNASDGDSKSLGALPTAVGWIARLAFARAVELGHDPGPLLRKAGLTDRQIRDRGARIPVPQQIQFLNLTAQALRDEWLGFELALQPDLRELGLLFYVAASSDNLLDVLRRAARYSSIGNEGVSIRCLADEEIRVVFDYVGIARHSDRHQIEFYMTVLMRLCRQLTGLHLVPKRVRLTHRRSGHDGSEFAAYFGAPVTFGSRMDELSFPAGAQEIKVTSADPYLNELLVANCEQALGTRPTGRSALRSAVENAIVPLLPHGKVRASQIAARLGLSQRTSARRLASEGVTFSEVLETLRSELARQYLSDPELSISRIAWLLGYTEVSAFTHAFKRRTGKTPREARAARQAARSN
jgi:AraC-like DNA-binding protein